MWGRPVLFPIVISGFDIVFQCFDSNYLRILAFDAELIVVEFFICALHENVTYHFVDEFEKYLFHCNGSYPPVWLRDAMEE